MTLGSTQPLTEMSTRNILGGKGRQAHNADNTTTVCEPIVSKMWKPRRLTTLWACYKDSFTFFKESLDTVAADVWKTYNLCSYEEESVNRSQIEVQPL
jgi:hypothetical protein